MYQRNVYDSDVIIKGLTAELFSLHRYKKLMVHEHTLESEETYDGFGWFPREETFYPVGSEDLDITYNDTLGGFIITFSNQSTQHTRSIYSALDFLGDVGGLLDMLRLVALTFLQFVALVTGSGIDAFLLGQIFKETTDRNKSAMREIKERKPFEVGWSLCCLARGSKRYRMLQRGLNRI